MQIIECPECAVKNRINAHSDGLKPICGRCGATLLQKNHKQTNSSSENTKFNAFLPSILIVLIIAVGYGIIATPKLIRKDFSLLIAVEAEKTETLQKQHENEIAAKKASLEKELAAIDAQNLHRNARKNYKMLLEARRSFDKRFALSPREKAQLRMRNLSSDSTKSFHDAIRSVAQEASPVGADISVHESSEGIALHKLTNDPFLDIYSTTKHFKIDADNFDEIEIKSTRI
ncbi:MAG: hypothetical protein ABIK98_06050 [Pseudomonadota bacterium]|uniref:Uncharacterized protein n=1 Tax=Candidatus Desulfatibia profunda TaxID=2841695 RepID=A0A8J6NS52_9BACT|nr:hypothetical protein [Candidatus Desulfatibia profunda]MBL7180039.1 hypothetical protein [Desulfobacterales bacterium]